VQQIASIWGIANKAADNAIFRIMGRYCSDEHWPAETGEPSLVRIATNRS
jgi:hypothetical protein